MNRIRAQRRQTSRAPARWGCILACFCIAAEAATVQSNGTGGGYWSDPLTWAGNTVPYDDDDVVVTAGDTVRFDDHADDRPSCRNLFVDPGGALTFEADGNNHVLWAGGTVDIYGRLQIDATAAPRGRIRFDLDAGTEGEPRLQVAAIGMRLSALRPALRVYDAGALLVYGADVPSEEQRNVLLSCGEDAPAEIRVGDGAMLDLHQARIEHVIVEADSLDNTGYHPNERVNVLANRFVRGARLILRNCDSPSVRDNRFEPGGRIAGAAASLYDCRLAAVRDNRIVGAYEAGFLLLRDKSSSVAGNVIQECQTGIEAGGENLLLRGNRIDRCETGIKLDGATGVMEDSEIGGAAVSAVRCNAATFQLTNVRLADSRANAKHIVLDRSAVTLLNCNVDPERVEVGAAPAPQGPAVDSMWYLVARVKGKAPDGLTVRLQTADVSGGPPPGQADLNVRNAFVRVSAGGLTPLPGTREPLTCRGWSLSAGGARREAPFYDLAVLDEPPAPGEPPRLLSRTVVQPKASWFRPEPDRPEPTLEVNLK